MTGRAGRRTGPGGGRRPDPEGERGYQWLLARATIILGTVIIGAALAKALGFGA